MQAAYCPASFITATYPGNLHQHRAMASACVKAYVAKGNVVKKQTSERVAETMMVKLREQRKGGSRPGFCLDDCG